MSYGLDLLPLPTGIDRDRAYQQYRDEQERAHAGESATEDPGPLDPAKEERKKRLVSALIKVDPELKVFDRDYAKIAANRSISEADAHRLFRNIELNDHRHSLQIELFDDQAGVSFSPAGRGETCANAVRTLWECLRILASAGGFSVFDPQIGRLLDLESDYETLEHNICADG
jgi:hypothetical protein